MPDDCAGKRLDQALALLIPEHSRNRLQQWIRDGRVALGGKVVCELKQKLRGRESLLILPPPDERQTADLPEDIPLDIIYADDAILVINKPAGLVVHPGAGNWSGTLQNALLFFDPSLATLPRAGIVHRLDKDTSGLMVVARTLIAQTDLVRQLQARTVRRDYTAVARGLVERDGIVDAPIGRHTTQRTRMAVLRAGKAARTRYRIVEHFTQTTLIECSLDTGRTHQIRVHMAHIGHPLVGDPLYGRGVSLVPRGAAFPRQALHARRLGLIHPVTGRSMTWKVPLPDDLAELIDALRLAVPDLPEEEEAFDDEGCEVIYAYDDDFEED